MFNVIIKRDEGDAVHTFRETDENAVFSDAEDFWIAHIELVQGYAHEGAAMCDTPDWKQRMLKEYSSDCAEAATEAARIMGQPI